MQLELGSLALAESVATGPTMFFKSQQAMEIHDDKHAAAVKVAQQMPQHCMFGAREPQHLHLHLHQRLQLRRARRL